MNAEIGSLSPLYFTPVRWLRLGIPCDEELAVDWVPADYDEQEEAEEFSLGTWHGA